MGRGYPFCRMPRNEGKRRFLGSCWNSWATSFPRKRQVSIVFWSCFGDSFRVQRTEEGRMKSLVLPFGLVRTFALLKGNLRPRDIIPQAHRYREDHAISLPQVSLCLKCCQGIISLRMGLWFLRCPVRRSSQSSVRRMKTVRRRYSSRRGAEVVPSSARPWKRCLRGPRPKRLGREEMWGLALNRAPTASGMTHWTWIAGSTGVLRS